MSIRHMLNFKDWSGRELSDLLELAIAVKQNPKAYWRSLDHLSLGMIFQKPSTRTRVSHEVAMTQLGGHAVYLDWRSTNLVMAELKDETRYLTRNVDGLLARVLDFAQLQEMADYARVPVVNGCDNKYHPTQALADFLTILEHKGRLDGIHLVYVGVHNNVANSLVEGGIKLGMKITAVTPEFNEASRDQELLDTAARTGLFHQTTALEAALEREIAKLLEAGVTDEEVATAKRRMLAEAAYARDSLTGPAQALGAALATGQSVDDVESWPVRIDAVTAAQVNAAARSVLSKTNHVTGLLLPPAGKES